MKCPECVKQNKNSCVYPGLSTTTAMYYYPYYDEKGNYHNHDGNITTTDYSCSNEHNFKIKILGSCWCGWGKDNDNN